MQNKCPCDSGLTYSACCEPIISGRKDAINAQELMQSRYTAFNLANVDYLMRSHSVKTRPVKERKNIERWAKSVVWIGINNSEYTKTERPRMKQAMWSLRRFTSKTGSRNKFMKNHSFHRENGKWVYVSGIHL